MYNLMVELPGESAKHYFLNADLVRIGRDDGNSIIVGEDTISGHHCELRRRGVGFEVADVGSTNGTRLNGEPLGAEAKALHDGDRLALGPTVKARFVRVAEIRMPPKDTAPDSGATTRKLEKPKLPKRPSINPVAAAVAKASRRATKN